MNRSKLVGESKKDQNAWCLQVSFNMAHALYSYCRNAGKHFVVTGSSGGLDSAITLALARMACRIAKKNGYKLFSVGVVLPCHSSRKSYELGQKAIKQFDAKPVTIILDDVYDYIFENSRKTIIDGNNTRSFSLSEDTDNQIQAILADTGILPSEEEWEIRKRIAQGNIKARLRMMLGTYEIAKKLDGIVLSTDNLSEFWMGFWTICGDVGDFGMIQSLSKGYELPVLGEYLGVLEDILDAEPDDGLNVAGGDADQLGADYEGVDAIMITAIQKGFDPDGSIDQVFEFLPKLNLNYSEDVIVGILTRSIRNSFKRKGTVSLTREELGLKKLEDIKLS